MDPNTFLNLGTLTPKNLQEITCFEKIRISRYCVLKQNLQYFANGYLVFLDPKTRSHIIWTYHLSRFRYPLLLKIYKNSHAIEKSESTGIAL